MIDCKIRQALQTIKKDNKFVTDTVTKREYTYTQCLGLAKSVSEQLHEWNKDSIAVILENGYSLFVLYFACMFANITIVPIDPQKGVKEIQEILDNHGEIPVICNGGKLPEGYDIHQVEECFEHAFFGEFNIDDNIWNTVDLEKVYMVTYTSGSTGKAKGVKHSLKNLFWSAISFGEKMGYGEDSVLCHTMPMTYMAGILNTIFLPFIMHSQIILFSRFSVITALSFWKNVIKYNVNTFWLSPTMLNILLQIDKKKDVKDYFSDKRVVFSIGTAPLREELKLEFEQRYGVTLYQSYGLSETLLLTTAPLDSYASNSSVGELLKEVCLRFEEDGEILIYVPWMFLGYYNESGNFFSPDGYYISGDFGEIKDKDLFITGRKKDLIVRGGMNISPSKIEKEIYQYEDIQECCVSGVMINGEEQTVCWYITQSLEHERIEHQINAMLVKSFGINYKIDCFKRVNNIAKNLNGKVDKNEMKKRFIEDVLHMEDAE